MMEQDNLLLRIKNFFRLSEENRLDRG